MWNPGKFCKITSFPTKNSCLVTLSPWKKQRVENWNVHIPFYISYPQRTPWCWLCSYLFGISADWEAEVPHVCVKPCLSFNPHILYKVSSGSGDQKLLKVPWLGTKAGGNFTTVKWGQRSGWAFLFQSSQIREKAPTKDKPKWNGNCSWTLFSTYIGLVSFER